METLELHLDHGLRSFRLALELELGAETVALVGPSGAGKSSVLRAIAGLLRPEHGVVLDLGCGAGRHAFEALRRGARVVAFDYDEAELKDVAAMAAALDQAGDIPEPGGSATTRWVGYTSSRNVFG